MKSAAAKRTAESAEMRKASNGAGKRGKSKCVKSADVVRKLSLSSPPSMLTTTAAFAGGTSALPLVSPKGRAAAREKLSQQPPTPLGAEGWSVQTPASLVRDMPAPEQAVLDAAIAILARRVREPGALIESPTAVREFVRLHLAGMAAEVFSVLFLDAQHRVIAFEPMFRGCVKKTHVYPREIGRRALELNASAVILTHNHPTGTAEPSASDLFLTHETREALRVLDITVLDHLVVGWPNVVSFAESGLMSARPPQDAAAARRTVAASRQRVRS